MDSLVPLLVGLVLLLGNAFFVGASFALVSVRKSQIEPLAKGGSRAARSTLRALSRVSLMMAGAQLGITICSLGLGAIAEPALAHLMEPVFSAVGLPEPLRHPLAFVLSLLIVVSLHVVVGEMIPKNLTLAAPDQAALVLGPALGAMVRAARPVVVGLNLIAAAVLRLFRVEPRDEVADAVTHEEIGHLLAESRREGLIDHEEHGRTAHALDFASRTAADAVTPLDELVTIGPESTAIDVERLGAATGHSRFPRRDDSGVLSGYVHLKDVLAAPPALRRRPIPPYWIRPLPAVRSDTSLVQVLDVLRHGSGYAARVDDENGETLGVITLDGILLRLVPSVHPAPDGEATVADPDGGTDRPEPPALAESAPT